MALLSDSRCKLAVLAINTVSDALGPQRLVANTARAEVIGSCKLALLNTSIVICLQPTEGTTLASRSAPAHLGCMRWGMP